MRRGATLALGLAAACCVALAAPAGRELARRRPAAAAATEFAFFPSGRLLDEMSLGHPRFTADIAWLAALQYYGKHRQTDRRYPLAPHVFEVITRADPGFRNAYLFGALVAAEDGNLEAAETLLRRGVERNPGSWELRFELGFFLYVYRHAWADAARVFQGAATLPGAPGYVERFAAATWERADRPELARLLWEQIARQTDNPEVRRIAEERGASLRRERAGGVG
jgi:hypothetical protein